MRQLAVAAFLGMLIALSCAACGDDAEPRMQVDAGKTHRDAAIQDQDDAAAGEAVSGSLDLHALLIAALIETENSLLARCPCLTSRGVYESMRQCTDAVSLGRNWVDCVNALDLSAQDNAENRDHLHCNIEEAKQRSQCLMGSGCNDDEVAVCMTTTLNCPQLPVDILSQVATHCLIAFSR